MKKILLNSLLITAFMLFAGAMFAQSGVKGVVKDNDTKETLIGANVTLEGTTYGTVADMNGAFTIDAPAGSYTLKVSYIGYQDKSITVSIKDGNYADAGSINLESSAIGLSEVSVLASVAIDRKTPVAVTTMNAKTIEDNLGSQEFPEVMKTTPNVYATKTGGGFGDARINVRGFDQRNVAVMINGIPVNDMENGWVYWSNWAGLGDATRTIQIQRGLGASKLAINSVGGTINIITKTTDMKKGGSVMLSATDYGRFKQMLSLSTGKLKSGTAITFVGSRTYGKGYIDATWVDAWSYFLSVSQDFAGGKHQLVFTAIGAPQHHGQRDGYYMLDSAKFNRYGPKYNQNWGYRGGEVLNIRENYYHKPQMALNWYWRISDKANLATSAYYSFGNGGGSGPLGINPYKYEPPKTSYGQYDWDQMSDINAANVDSADARKQGMYTVDNGDTTYMHRSLHIIRNSVNNHKWYGLLSTLTVEMSDLLTLTAGIDARHYKGEHYREVRDLIGGDYWSDSKFGASTVGDKIAYWNDGIVTYGGLFAQLELSAGNLSAFVAATASNTWTKRIDYRSYLPEESEAVSDVLSNMGYNFKIGANYNISERSNIFINGGYYSRVPFFRFMFLNYKNIVNPDLTNEKITSAELGYNYIAPKFNLKVNGYYSIWGDISQLTGFVADNGDYVNAFLSSLQEIHTGIELEASFVASRWLNLGGMINIGDWKYSDDATATLYDDQTHDPIGEGTIYTKDLKVGNQPQQSFGINGTFKIAKSLDIGINYLYYMGLYADFTPESRKNPDVRAQAFQLPNYGMVDARLGWSFKIAGLDSYFNWNVYNLMNNVVLVEAEDRYNSGREEFAFKKGFWSWGRNMNFSLKVRF
jgi:hypothetical protein